MFDIDSVELVNSSCIEYTRASDTWAAGLVANDMGTGCRLFGNPESCTQLLTHIFGVLSDLNIQEWPELEKLPGYQHYCRQAQADKLEEPREPWIGPSDALSLLEHSSGLTPGTRSPVPLYLPPDMVAVALAVQGTLVMNPASRLTAAAVSSILNTAVLAEHNCQHISPIPPYGLAAATPVAAALTYPLPPQSGQQRQPLQSEKAAALLSSNLPSSAHSSEGCGEAAAAPHTAVHAEPGPAPGKPPGQSHKPKDSASSAAGISARQKRGIGVSTPNRQTGLGTASSTSKCPRIQTAQAAGLSRDTDEEAGWEVCKTTLERERKRETQEGALRAGMTLQDQCSEEPPAAMFLRLTPGQTDQGQPGPKRCRVDRRPAITADNLPNAPVANSGIINYVTTSFVPKGCSSISTNFWPASPIPDTGLVWVHDSDTRGPRLAQFLSPAEFSAACRNMHCPAEVKTKPADTTPFEAKPAETSLADTQNIDSAGPADRPSLGSSTDGRRQSGCTAQVQVPIVNPNVCVCTGRNGCTINHTGKCTRERAEGSVACSQCKCVSCKKRRSRSIWCWGCAHKHLTPTLARVQLLAPVLSLLVPADTEQFILLWPAIKSNLFAQVVIAWVSEPFAMTYLSTRMKPNATPAATHKVLLDACRHVAALTPPHLTEVAQDISGNGTAQGIGFRSAMVGLGVALGVACTSLSTSASTAASASRRAAGLVQQLRPQALRNLRPPQQSKAPRQHTGWQLLHMQLAAGRSRITISQPSASSTKPHASLNL